MRFEGVVNALSLAQLQVQRRHLQRAGRVIRLFGGSALGALDGAPELGRARRQDKQAQPALLAGLLEVSGEFAATINLQSPDREPHPLLLAAEELRGDGDAGARGCFFKGLRQWHH